jgi:hypothetical protein
MYNDDTKKLFIESLKTDDLRRMYTSIFKRTETYETEREMDVYNFNVKECMNLLLHLNPKSIGHVGSLRSQFSKYIEWAIRKGLTTKNYWSLVSVDDEFVRFSFENRNVKDLDELTQIVESSLAVPYDKYVIYLLYMGVMGENFAELIQLKNTDIDKTNKVITTARRKYNSLVEPLFDVIASSTYYEEKKQRDYDSPYFVKPFKTKHLIGEPIGYQHVHRVVQKMNDSYNEQNPDNQKQFAPTTIWRSGLFFSLYKTELTKGELVTDDYYHVSEIYGNKNCYSSYLRDYELYKDVFWKQKA